MQVDPIRPTLKAPGIKRLKLILHHPLSNFAFEFNLSRYNKASKEFAEFERKAGAYTRSHFRST